MQSHSFDSKPVKRRETGARRLRPRRTLAENRPSIGFALHNRFPHDEQPDLASFAQVMAHRIRGLLTGIEGYTDLLLSHIESREQREYALRVLESTSRIEGILSDLQHYNDPLEAHFHKIPAVGIPDDVLSALADSEVVRLKLECNIPEDVFLRADESLIRQALLAIIQNAFEAEGLTSSSIYLSASISQDQSHVVYEIRNTGSHLTAQQELQAFQPFYTTKSSNLGLGLTLARRIAHIHRGDLKIASSGSSEYTEFSFSLPVYCEDEPPA